MAYRKWKNSSHENGRLTPTYKSWSSMITRCRGRDAHHKKYYGDVLICERWRESFDAFVEDMGTRPRDTSLDRWPNKNGAYKPGNCRWATKGQQTNNMSKNVVLDIGMFTGTVAEWMRALKIPYKHDKAIYFRLENGFTPYEALFTPIGKGANQFTPKAVEPGA